VQRRTALLILIPLVLAAAAAVLVLPRILRPSAVDVNALVSRLDADLGGGYLATAREELMGLRDLPGSENDLVRIIKRAVRLGAASGDYGPLWSVASRALRARPRSAPIRAAAAYADMRTGRLADAEKALKGGPLPPGTGDALRGETAIRRGQPWSGEDSLTRDLLALETSREPGAYAAAALRTGDARIALDAALLAMGAGSVASARSIVGSELGGSRWDGPAAAILYDASDDTGALARLQRLATEQSDHAETALLAADVLVSLGRPADAEQSITRGLAIKPDISTVPYLDLAWFATLKNDLELARQRLVEGLGWFPRAASLSVALARVDAAEGHDEDAVNVLNAVLTREPGNVDASLLLLDLKAASLSPEAYRARLWKLSNVNPSDLTVLSALLSSLIAAQDWTGVSIALRQNEAAGGSPSADLLLLKGMASAMAGDGSSALAFFQKAGAARRDGAAAFDSALVQLAQGRAEAALGSLDAAAAENERKGNQPAFLSRVMQLRGEAYMLQNNLPAARTALERARELDPANLRATLILSKLEAPTR
jgi:tetratricopeptide (TPR) repeat protein